jgi:hypothetical protein
VRGQRGRDLRNLWPHLRGAALAAARLSRAGAAMEPPQASGGEEPIRRTKAVGRSRELSTRV